MGFLVCARRSAGQTAVVDMPVVVATGWQPVVQPGRKNRLEGGQTGKPFGTVGQPKVDLAPQPLARPGKDIGAAEVAARVIAQDPGKRPSSGKLAFMPGKVDPVFGECQAFGPFIAEKAAQHRR